MVDTAYFASKVELRKHIRELVTAIGIEERIKFSNDVKEEIVRCPFWQVAREVMLFWSLPDEVDTVPLIREALAANKRVYLPRVVPGGDLEIREYVPCSMKPGKWGIFEPDEEAPLLRDYSLLDLVIVPGIAFTSAGVRLGRGKSFYDRLLPKIPSAKFVGVCYPCQIVEKIPADSWDIQMERVCCGK